MCACVRASTREALPSRGYKHTRELRAGAQRQQQHPPSSRLYATRDRIKFQLGLAYHNCSAPQRAVCCLCVCRSVCTHRRACACFGVSWLDYCRLPISSWRVSRVAHHNICLPVKDTTSLLRLILQIAESPINPSITRGQTPAVPSFVRVPFGCCPGADRDTQKFATTTTTARRNCAYIYYTHTSNPHTRTDTPS